MLVKVPPMETKVEHTICEFHKRNPYEYYAGCTCSHSYSAVIKPLKDWTEDERRYAEGADWEYLTN